MIFDDPEDLVKLSPRNMVTSIHTWIQSMNTDDLTPEEKE